jgi:hypothetical protein
LTDRQDVSIAVLWYYFTKQRNRNNNNNRNILLITGRINKKTTKMKTKRVSSPSLFHSQSSISSSSSSVFVSGGEGDGGVVVTVRKRVMPLKQSSSSLPMLLLLFVSLLLLLMTHPCASVTAAAASSSDVKDKGNDLYDHLHYHHLHLRSPSSSSSSSSSILPQQQQQQEHRSLQAYDLYSLPEVFVTLNTVWTDDLDRAYRLALSTTSTTTSTATTPTDSLLLISQTGRRQQPQPQDSSSSSSSLGFPYRTVTQNYFYQGYQTLISTWERTLPQNANANGDGGDVEQVHTQTQTQEDGGSENTSSAVASDMMSSFTFYSMYNHLVTVDIQVKLYVDLRQTTNNNNNNLDDIILDATPITLIAELLPTLAFLEPSSTTATTTTATNNNKPGNDEIADLFGYHWMMDVLLERDVAQYQQSLQASANPSWMQSISNIHAELADDERFDLPIATSNNSNSGTGGWSQRTEKAMLTLMILVIVGAVVAFVLLAYRRRRHRRKTTYLAQLGALHHGELDLENNRNDRYYDDDDDDRYHDEYSHASKNKIPRASLARSFSDAASQSDRSFVSHSTTTNNNNNNNNTTTGGASSSSSSTLKRPAPLDTRCSSLDSARHGADVFHRTSTMNAMTALEASDRYLSKHRPDLYYHHQNHQNNNNNANNANNNSFNVFGRTYEIPSNPFDVLGGYFSFSQSAAQQHQNTAAAAAAAAHFPFSPSAFATPTNHHHHHHHAAVDPRRSSSSSFMTSPSPSNSTTTAASANSAFTPIPNLAATAHKYNQQHYPDNSMMDHHHNSSSNNSTTAGTRQGAHTGQSWQNFDGWHQHHDYSHSSSSSSSIGNIFRNLSMTAWMGNNNGNNSQQNNNDYEEEDLSFHHHANDPGDIELEDLPADYDFPFQDFPRTDGTPCLIYNEDALQERERQKQAQEIFAVSDDLEEKKEDHSRQRQQTQRRTTTTTTSVSDSAFRRMLSDHSLTADDNENDNDDHAGILLAGGEEDAPILLPVETRDADDSGAGGDDGIGSAKSPKFQQQLSRLMETKQRRYAMEYKKEAIVQEQRKKRKNFREKQRLERHKAMERDLEEIEAEFLSPLTRAAATQQQQQQQQQHTAPLSPTISNKTAASPISKLAARSPILQRLGMGGGGAARQHKKHNSFGSSPFRRRGSGQHSSSSGVPSPGNFLSASRSGGSGGSSIFRTASYQEGETSSSMSSSLPPSMRVEEMEFDVSQEYKMKVRPVNMFESDMLDGGAGGGVDLTLPTMSGHGKNGSTAAAATDTKKYPSPQSVVDEAMQQSTTAKVVPTAGVGGRHPHIFNIHRRTRTPSKVSAATGSQQQHRRIHSIDVPAAESSTIDGGTVAPFVRSPLKRSNSSHRRSGSSSSMGGSGGGSGTPTKDRYHRRSNSQHSLGGRRHRRSNSQSSQHRRSNSSNQKEEDIFLHGVVATTRFV